MKHRIVPQPRARRQGALAVAGVLAGCSLTYDFDRPAPEGLGGAADASIADDGVEAGRPDLAADARPPDAAVDAGDRDAARPDAGGDAELDAGVDAEPDATAPELDMAAGDATSGLPDSAVIPDRCEVAGERRLIACHEGADTAWAQPGATLGARRVEICRDGRWQATVACAHGPPDVCAVACGGCPSNGAPQVLPMGELASPIHSTLDFNLRYLRQVAPLPTRLPAFFHGWAVRYAHLSNGDHFQVVRTFGQDGRQLSQTSGPCLLLNGMLQCSTDSRRTDTWYPAQAGGMPPYVIRRRIQLAPGVPNVEVPGDLFVLTVEGHRVVRTLWSVVPPEYTGDPFGFDPVAEGYSEYAYDDFGPAPHLLVERVYTGRLEADGELAWSVVEEHTRYDDRMRPVAINRQRAEPERDPDSVIWQRQLDTDCLDCGPQGCRPTTLVSECDYVGFTHTPMGACRPRGGTGVRAAGAALLCAGLVDDAADRPIPARLAVLHDDLDWERVARRLLRTDAVAPAESLTAWVDVRRQDGRWVWGDGRAVPAERLGNGMVAETDPPVGSAVYLDPRLGRLSLDVMGVTERRALCAQAAPNPSLLDPVVDAQE